MDSNNEVEKSQIIKVRIQGDRSDESKTSVNLVFGMTEDILVDLTNSEIKDIKALFNEIFDMMIQRKSYLVFELDDGGKTDLYHDVAEQIITQINSEISQAKDNINQIWELADKGDDFKNETK